MIAPHSVGTWGQPLPGRGQSALGVVKMPPPASNVFGGRGGTSVALIGKHGLQSAGSVRDPVGAGPKQAAVLMLTNVGKNRTLRDAFASRPEGLRTPVTRFATPEIRAVRIADADKGARGGAASGSRGSPLDAAIQLVIAAEGTLPEDAPEAAYKEITSDAQRLRVLKAASASRGLTDDERAFVDGVAAKYGQMVQALAAEGVEGARAIVVENARVPLQERQKELKINNINRDYQNEFARVRELVDEVNREERMTDARARRRDLLERNMEILRRDWGEAFVEGDREAIAELDQLWAMTRNGLQTLDRQDRVGLVKLASLGREADNAAERTEDLENKLQEAVETPIGASRAAAMREEQANRFARHDREKALLINTIRVGSRDVVQAVTDEGASTREQMINESDVLREQMINEGEQNRRRARFEGDATRKLMEELREQMSQESYDAENREVMTRDVLVNENQQIKAELAAARLELKTGVEELAKSTTATRRVLGGAISAVADALDAKGVELQDAIKLSTELIREESKRLNLRTSRDIEDLGTNIADRVNNVPQNVFESLEPRLTSVQAETTATKAAVGALAQGLTGTNIQVRRRDGTFLGREEGKEEMSAFLTGTPNQPGTFERIPAVNSGSSESGLVAARSGIPPTPPPPP